MIKPHGSKKLNSLFVSDDEYRNQLEKEGLSLPSLILNSSAAANAVMLGAGYFNPLDGYMDLKDSLSVSKNLHMANGLFWPTPIVNLAKDINSLNGAERIALRDPNSKDHPIIALMDIENIELVTDEQIQTIAADTFGTVDINHPGVKTFCNLGNYLISGRIEVLNFSYFRNDYPDTFKTAQQIRDEIEYRGWKKIVAFQTRNPMHRAHEELCRMAMKRLGADGVIVHMLLGKLKKGDVPAAVRDACIRKMVDLYFPENSVMVNGYGFDMLYAGPREAILHAIFRQNMGATHLIIGRDHAGVGDFYGAFDAQEIFKKKVPSGSLNIEIFPADHTAYSKKLNKVVMMNEVDGHSKEDFITLSGTKVRQMLNSGIAPPPEFSRPEVSEILMNYYRSIEDA
ncbi:MAG: sulfate adenylyltransferase [Porticoccus sp.]|nr:sulfate adenylyltransferase [Porticoccus sp.]